jgi:hypothetical protein
MKYIFMILFFVIGLISCGEYLEPSNIIVRSRAITTFGMQNSDFRGVLSMNQGTTITFANPANSSMTLNTSALVVPTITQSVLSFGNIGLSALTDNDLKVCGGGGNTKCTKAYLQAYISTDWGLPTTVKALTMSTSPTTLETLNIPANKNTVNLSDFSTVSWPVTISTLDASAGNYSTQLIIQYALGL